MNIRHHVSEEFLYLYTSGELGPLWSLAVATHLAFCPHCRRRAADLEEVQGVALEQETPEPIMQLQAMDVIAQAGQVKEHAPYRMRTDKMGDAPVFPTPLRDLHGDLKDIRWRTVGGGVQQCVLRRDGNVSARLLKSLPVLLYHPMGMEVSSLHRCFRAGISMEKLPSLVATYRSSPMKAPISRSPCPMNIAFAWQ